MMQWKPVEARIQNSECRIQNEDSPELGEISPLRMEPDLPSGVLQIDALKGQTKPAQCNALGKE